MPKSKVRKKAPYTPPRTAGGGSTVAPAKVAGPTHPVYVAVMLGLMLAGLAWIVTYYLAGDQIGIMMQLGDGLTMLIGFALIVIGLFMTMRWR